MTIARCWSVTTLGLRSEMARLTKTLCLLLSMMCGGVAWTQASAGGEHLERGYLSPSAYANAFFGFRVSILEGVKFQELRTRKELSGGQRLLFGLHSDEGGTGFVITAERSAGPKAATARGTVRRLTEDAEKTTIGGREFCKGLSSERTRDGVMRQASYAVELNGYVVDFYVSSRNEEIFVKWCKAVEGLQLFDPAKAKEMAGADSVPYSRE